MLTKIKLTYFQRHEDLTVQFDAGLTSVKGANEQGKSTVIRAILYALYGSRALPAPLSAVVTWGHNEKDLKVDLEMFVAGETYTFIRSKAGAEVLRGDSVYVTGQTEVSAFAANLIGADLATANRLMVANQGNLRGALEAGPKAAAEMVESLADFELFDTLLERASERLALGSDVPAKDRLEDATERLESLKAERPDTSQWEAVIAKVPGEVSKVEAEVESVLRPALDTASQALDQAKNNRSTYDLLNNNLAKVQRSLDDAKTQRIAAEAKSAPVDTSPIKGLQEEIDGVESREAQRRVFEQLLKLNDKYPEDAYWDGNSESLQAEISKVEADVETFNSQLNGLNEKKVALSLGIKAMEAKIQKNDHCSACGQKLQDHKEIAKRNAELQKQIDAKFAERSASDVPYDDLAIKVASLREDLSTLKFVLSSAAPFDAFIRSNAQYLQVDDNFVPPRILWKGREPSNSEVDADALRKQIAQIEADAEAAANAKARAKALEQTIADYEAQVTEYASQLEGYKLENVEQYQEAKDQAYAKLANAQGLIDRLKDEMREAQTQIKLAEQSYEQQKALIAEMQERVDAAKQEIEDLAFNNTLVKRIRELRPVVSNQLWNLVLSAVSTMFTTMRGERSVVSRDKDGFKVNGENIDTLSGSTLDLLALAIREALLKTFVPNCPFFCLDEPFAAMDAHRTQEALGFISTLDFPQVLLISHEDVTEQVADNLVTL